MNRIVSVINNITLQESKNRGKEDAKLLLYILKDKNGKISSIG